MNYSTAIILLNDDIKLVEVAYEPASEKNKFPSTKTLKTLRTDLKVGDYVIVPSSTRFNLTTAQITKINAEIDLETQVKIDWVIGTVDMGDFQKIAAKEAAFIEHVKKSQAKKKRDELKRDLLGLADEEMARLTAVSASVAIEDNTTAGGVAA